MTLNNLLKYYERQRQKGDGIYLSEKYKSKYKSLKCKLNPQTKKGKISSCVICDSKVHCSREYPHCQQSANVTETVSFYSNEENKI